MRVEESVVIDRPIDEVWASLTDLFNGPRAWGRHVLAVRQTSPGPFGVGSTMQIRMVILGFETRLNMMVSEWDPPHVVAFRGASGGPFRSGTLHYDLQTVGNGTRMVRSAEIEPNGPMKLVWPLFRPFALRGMRGASRNVKTFIEGKPR